MASFALARPTQFQTRPLVLQQQPNVSDVQRYGYRMTVQMLQVLQDWLDHHNRDGSRYRPDVTEASVRYWHGKPFYFTMVIDPQALWHFREEDVLGPQMLGAMEWAVRRPVRAFKNKFDGSRIACGYVYVVQLQDLPALAATPDAALPKISPLDLGGHDLAGKMLVPVGVSPRGEVWKPLPDNGHMLIVGASGAGKSTWTHCALAALLPNNTPAQVQVALIDPKRNELTPWSGVPHRFGEYATTPAQAEKLLADVVAEMDRRGELLAGALCRDVRGYNATAPHLLSYLVVVIDECLDLVLAAGSRSPIAESLKSIAIRGRSAGVILWASTQHASAVDGLPRVVNTNLTTRLVFRVADENAARSAGCPGAHLIPASTPGRMLARLDGAPMMMQSFYLDAAAVNAAAQAVAGQMAENHAARLTERERQIAVVVLTNLGEFNIADVARAVGEDRADMVALAKEWEERGWLTPVQRTQRGARPRQVTDALIALIEESAQSA